MVKVAVRAIFVKGDGHRQRFPAQPFAVGGTRFPIDLYGVRIPRRLCLVKFEV